MSPAARGAIALLVGVVWFGWAAERATAALEGFRPAPRGQASAQDLARSGALLTLPPAGRALAAEAKALAEREDRWGYVVAALLSPAERAEGLTRAADAPQPKAAPGMTIEPEMPFLVEAILARYGPRTLPAPDVPRREQWPMVDRRSRARALTALVRGPGLDDDRAAIVLGVTLDLLDAQSRRTEIEAELADLLPD